MHAHLDAKKQDARAALIQAYNAAVLNSHAFAGKLRPIDHYLKPDCDDASRGGAALLGALHAMKRKGVPMTIERVA